MMMKTYLIGGLNRTSFRRALQSAGLEYSEDKALLDSQFVVMATAAQHQVFIDRIDEINFRAAFTDYVFKIKNGDKADAFEKYVGMFSQVEIIKKKGWFKTKFKIFCHPTEGKLFQIKASELT